MYRPRCARRLDAAALAAAALALAVTACGPRPGTDEDPAAPFEDTRENRVDTDDDTAAADKEAQPWPASKVPKDTFVSVSGPDPTSLDPAQVYETGGMGLDMSFYDRLVAFKREMPNEFVPALATDWSVSPDGTRYTFQIRDGVEFHAGGTLEPHDAAYSIQRLMLRDASGGPSWMFLRPVLDVSAIRDLVQQQAGVTPAAGEESPAMADLPEAAKLAACQAVQEAVVADDAAGTVTIQLHAATPWFMQLMATWLSSIVDQEWMVEQGDWDGSCATWTRWHDIPAEESVLYDRENGTGPYRLGSWKKKESFTLEANEAYWRSEPAWEDGPSGPPRIKHVILQLVPEWSTRYAKVLAGEADHTLVAGTDIDQVEPLVGLEYMTGDDTVEPVVQHEDGTLKLYRGFPLALASAIHIQQQVATEGGNEFIGSGRFDGDGVPPDFFSDIHVRKAFNHCFDWDTYIRDVLHGDGVQSRGPIIQGLQGYEADSPVYGFDLEQCRLELELAWQGRLAETGFRITAPYAEGGTDAQAAFDLLADGLGQVDPKYRLTTVQMEWPTMLDNVNRGRLPLSLVGWLEDYHDASNWAQAYLYSTGAILGSRGWSPELTERINGLVDRGLIETDPAERDAVYAELQRLAYDEALAIYLHQSIGRQYLRREVRGWFFNPISTDGQYYAMWKE